MKDYEKVIPILSHLYFPITRIIRKMLINGLGNLINLIAFINYLVKMIIYECD
jgi:hypothetical protein